MRLTAGMILKSLLDARLPGNIALSASGRVDLTYGQFAAVVEDSFAALRTRGLARNDKLEG